MNTKKGVAKLEWGTKYKEGWVCLGSVHQFLKSYFPGSLLYQLALDALTNYHKLNDLTQIYYLKVLEIGSLKCFHWMKLKMVARPHSFWRFQGRIPSFTFSSFQQLPALLDLWVLLPSLKETAQFLSFNLSLTLTLLSAS